MPRLQDKPGRKRRQGSEKMLVQYLHNKMRKSYCFIVLMW